MAERSKAVEQGEVGTLADLLHRLTAQVTMLFRQEVKLAISEVSGSFKTLLGSLASVLSGGAVLYAGFLLLLFAAVVGLAAVMPLWLASLGIGLVVVGGGYALIVAGKRRLNVSDLAPTHSPESLRRDRDVLTRKIS